MADFNDAIHKLMGLHVSVCYVCVLASQSACSPAAETLTWVLCMPAAATAAAPWCLTPAGVCSAEAGLELCSVPCRRCVHAAGPLCTPRCCLAALTRLPPCPRLSPPHAHNAPGIPMPLNFVGIAVGEVVLRGVLRAGGPAVCRTLS
jgi:hypothetical protein